MFKINWGVRLKNQLFWIAVVPAIIALIQAIAELFNYRIDLATTQDKLIHLIEVLFSLLVIVGVVNDPTTKGVKDSEQALNYEKPK